MKIHSRLWFALFFIYIRHTHTADTQTQRHTETHRDAHRHTESSKKKYLIALSGPIPICPSGTGPAPPVDDE